MKKTIIAAAMALVLSSSIASARDVSFTIVNKTGGTLEAMYGGPSSSGEWGDNILDGEVATGGTVTVSISGTSTCKYDFRYEVSNKEPYEEYAIDICKIDGAEFTIK